MKLLYLFLAAGLEDCSHRRDPLSLGRVEYVDR